MSPQEQQQDEALQNVNNPLKVMQPGERVLCEIKRHPFGLFGIYASFAFVLVIAVAAIVVAPQLVPSMSSQGQAMVALGAVIICALVGVFTYISSMVYKGNRWIVTSDSLTQVAQISLFRKQTSQLSLANLEDVTVEQDGMLQSMFGFGRLRAETAGERGKFIFDFCPKPSEYAKLIIGAHEAYIAEKPSEMYTTNRPLANTTSFNQSGPQQYDPSQQVQQPTPGYQQQEQYTPVQQPYQQQQPVPQQPFDPTRPGTQQPVSQAWQQQGPGGPSNG